MFKVLLPVGGQPREKPQEFYVKVNARYSLLCNQNQKNVMYNVGLLIINKTEML